MTGTTSPSEAPGPEPVVTEGGPEALAEASPESLAELFSRDPEGYGSRDLARIVAAMRANRAKWAEAEAASAAAPKVVKGKLAPNLIATASPGDLGL